MKLSQAVKPHGNILKNLLADPARVETLKNLSMSIPDITMRDHHLCDFELLATGAFSPLEGYMVRADYEAVLDRMQLDDGTLWPLPICLDIPDTSARNMEAGQSVALRDPEGFLLGVLHVEDMWPVDTEKEIASLYGKNDKSHPGVQHLLTGTDRHYIGGKLEASSPFSK